MRGTTCRCVRRRAHRTTPLPCAGKRLQHAIAHRSEVASSRTRIPRNPVLGREHRRADATLAARCTLFSPAHRIRPRAARRAPT
ncbi:hypothetical protein DIE23_23675 [Burkholderia sp. Bp9143]|nr:hypothetical protein DIE23_23675 [Burkholderia sp. Bp9143]